MRWQENNIDISKVRGGKMPCPKCSHDRKHKSDPCLSVDLRTGLFNCHHCGYKGSAADYVKPQKIYVKPPARLEKLSPSIIGWFEKDRAISNNTLLRFGITQSVEWMPKAQKEVNAICFNYYRDEILVNIKYRASGKDFRLFKDAELVFYNMDSLKGLKTAVIVEGEIDCLSMHEAGIYNCISVPNGASKGNQKLEYLENCWHLFEGMENIVIAVDNDEAGNSLRDELARRLNKSRCSLVDWPEGCKDANEVLIKFGKAALKQMVESATLYPLDGVVTVENLAESVMDMYSNGYPQGFYAGVEGFDEHLSFMQGQLTMVTGIPGCFHKGQLIHTSQGIKRISEINKGDMVLSYNHQKEINEFRKVTATHHFKDREDKMYLIKLKDGTEIKVTESHEFFTGTEYVKISKLLLSLSKDKLCGK